jgi:probable F420-dependent oxidoreductase
VLAKECATLDQLSGGRLVLGVGAGWLEEEFAALEVSFSDRGRRLDDYIAALRAAWGDQPASFDGEFARFGEVYSMPRPVAGRIPVVVGGHSEAAARRAGRLGDGFFPGRGSESSLGRLLATMREAALAAGRDPDAIEVTAAGNAALGPEPVEALRRLADLGVHRVVIPPLTYNPGQIGDALAEFAGRVVANVA